MGCFVHGLPTKLGEVSTDTFFYVHKQTGELVVGRRPKDGENYHMYNRYCQKGEKPFWTVNKVRIQAQYLPEPIKLYLTLEE